MSVTKTPSSIRMPDLPGKVHGYKGDRPHTVQCDDCLTCFAGDFLLEVAKSAVFNSREGSRDRLCYPCWEKRGWRDGHRGWERV